MPFNVDDDEYVAKLLAQDAKKTSKTYDMVGLDAFNPKRNPNHHGEETIMATTKQRITRGNDARDIEMSVQNHGQGGTEIEAGKETGTRGDTATATMSERISRGVSEITETTTADIVTTVRGRTGDLVANVERVGNLTPASDSDPLEAIVGPLPPPPEPTVRSRGRGALKANNLGIESRFSTNYNPSIDMKPGSDAEDDWVEALEVMRDRERWKQQGADRLRAAGFKDEQVKKWEKGGDPLEEDVVWSKRGQDREWDRGKVVDEDGDIDLKADWGRLK
ncbi:hypothetical protein SLS59_000135 [Nothophoma quercina]|uniref:Uncharacterized protein n=1 Tax=Nothophoma quercina TaxID=749835 RepID=A0ABR3S415_9PLEO